MTDVILLYAFTRLDAIRVGLGTGIGLCIVLALVYACAASDSAYEKNAETLKLRKSTAKKLVAAAVAFMVLVVVTPTKTDLAVIVGGKIALDAGRTDTAKEIGQEVLGAIRSKLREVSGK